MFAGQQTPELPDLWAGPGGFCSADPEPEEHCTWSSEQPCYRHRRFLWRDALRLVQDEIPQYSCWVRYKCSCVRASGLISPKITEEYSVMQVNIFRDLWSLHTKEHWRDKRGNYPAFEIQLFLDRVLAQCFCSLSFGFSTSCQWIKIIKNETFICASRMNLTLAVDVCSGENEPVSEF